MTKGLFVCREKYVRLLTLLGLLLTPVGASRAEETWASIIGSTVRGLWEDNKDVTLGGPQLWTDEFVFRSWRIQKSALTGEYRLLDGDERRLATGTYDECLAKFETLRQSLAIDPITGRVILLVHGLTGQRQDVSGLGSFLRDHCSATVLLFGYASTRGSLDDHAAALAKVIDRLGPDVERLDLVGYSMGNLVIRRYLHDHDEPRLKRLVMIAPPNHGAKLAADWGDHPLFLTVVGAAAHQMGAGWETTAKQLARPNCEFGIIAGCRGTPEGFSAKLAGDDDILLSVSTTRLAGATDFTQIEGIHHLLPRQQICRERVLRFLQQGYFVSADERAPIEAD